MKKSLSLGLILSIAALLAVVGTEAFAQAQAPSVELQMKATVISVSGDVLIYAGEPSAAHNAKLGEIIGAGARIETKANGNIAIKLDNDNSVTLQPNSNLTLEKLILDQSTGDYENIFNSDAGTIMAKVAKLKGKSKFQVKTPTAICGARGTLFVLVITAGETRVFAVEGTVGMETSSGQTFVVSTNMAAVSNIGGTVTELTGAEKDAIIAAYNAFVAAGGEAKDISATPSPIQPPPNPERPESSQYN